MTSEKKKTCFVICPIGGPESVTRRRSDEIFNALIKNVLSRLNYECERIVDENRPGSITDRIVEKLHDADLVIADLTDNNPNVFYELAIRQYTQLPVILMSENIDEIPFDTKSMNTIEIRTKSLADMRETEDLLVKQVLHIESDGYTTSDLITSYALKRELLEAGKVQEVQILDLRTSINELQKSVNHIESLVRGRTIVEPGRLGEHYLDYSRDMDRYELILRAKSDAMKWISLIISEAPVGEAYEASFSLLSQHIIEISESDSPSVVIKNTEKIRDFYSGMPKER